MRTFTVVGVTLIVAGVFFLVQGGTYTSRIAVLVVTAGAVLVFMGSRQKA